MLLSEFLNLPPRWKKNERWLVTLSLSLRAGCSAKTFFFLQIMFCNPMWMVSYTGFYNSYFRPGNSFEKRTVAMAARSENESRVVPKAPAIEPVFRRLSRLQASLSLWARSGQSYLCLKVFLGVYMYVSKYVCVSMSVKLSLNYMYVSYFFVCNKGRDW